MKIRNENTSTDQLTTKVEKSYFTDDCIYDNFGPIGFVKRILFFAILLWYKFQYNNVKNNFLKQRFEYKINFKGSQI